jgi:hypothetical protein
MPHSNPNPANHAVVTSHYLNAVCHKDAEKVTHEASQ